MLQHHMLTHVLQLVCTSQAAAAGGGVGMTRFAFPGKHSGQGFSTLNNTSRPTVIIWVLC